MSHTNLSRGSTISADLYFEPRLFVWVLEYRGKQPYLVVHSTVNNGGLVTEWKIIRKNWNVSVDLDLSETLKSYVEEGSKPEILILERNNSWATKIILQLAHLCLESAASKAVTENTTKSQLCEERLDSNSWGRRALLIIFRNRAMGNQ
jgi:hypothetical protein